MCTTAATAKATAIRVHVQCWHCYGRSAKLQEGQTAACARYAAERASLCPYADCRALQAHSVARNDAELAEVVTKISSANSTSRPQAAELIMANRAVQSALGFHWRGAAALFWGVAPVTVGVFYTHVLQPSACDHSTPEMPAQPRLPPAWISEWERTCHSTTYHAQLRKLFRQHEQTPGVCSWDGAHVVLLELHQAVLPGLLRALGDTQDARVEALSRDTMPTRVELDSFLSQAGLDETSSQGATYPQLWLASQAVLWHALDTVQLIDAGYTQAAKDAKPLLRGIAVALLGAAVVALVQRSKARAPPKHVRDALARAQQRS